MSTPFSQQVATLLMDKLGVRPALQWWDSVTATFKVASNESGQGLPTTAQLLDMSGCGVTYSDVAPVRDTLMYPSDITDTIVTQAGAGNATVVPAVANQTTRVHRMTISANAPTAVTFFSGTTAITPAIYLGGNAPVVWEFDSRAYLTTAANSALTMNVAAAATVGLKCGVVTSA